jgi:hypothetical protein
LSKVGSRDVTWVIDGVPELLQQIDEIPGPLVTVIQQRG